ncbi:MAG: phosphopantetheine-binding protein, partial [Pseudomonadota bacterium]
ARDDVERKLVAIWEEFLPGGTVGIDDDFFSLGGTSLGAVRILSRIKSEFAVEVPLEALLGSEPTIATVAQTVRERLADEPAASDSTAMPALVPASASDASVQAQTSATTEVAVDPELDALLSAVEQLSDDEAQAALSTKDLN